MWETFNCDPFSLCVYLESLEPYLLSEQVTELPPAIAQHWVTHYSNRGKMEALEATIQHIPVHCLDIHQVSNRSNG